jgi:signal transduction histidine kinase
MNPIVSSRARARGIFSGLKIRKKLIVLHTSFSLALGSMLLIALSPAMSKLIDGAEQDLALLVLDELGSHPDIVETLNPDRVRIRRGEPESLGMEPPTIERLRDTTQGWSPLMGDDYGAGILAPDPNADGFIEIRTRSQRSRDKTRLIYALLIVTLLAGYALVAIALELFVLPQHVYSPIRALLRADDAVRSKDSTQELVPAESIPADELGEIMHSRNETVRQLRAHQSELAHALERLESVAIDLHKKNLLLETARRNLEGADRLASLGMMSAGIAHELNTPLAVVKGLVEKLDREGTLSPAELKLLTRVVGRIEKLSEGLLDFARVRTPETRPTRIHSVVRDAWDLLKFDRQSVPPTLSLTFINDVDPSLEIGCDPDRMVQVFVNLIRNAVNALDPRADTTHEVRVWSRQETRDAQSWAVLSVEDTGRGLDSEVIDSILEPFVSTRLDAHGTGLGLAVSEGIVREHGGFIVPSNKSTDRGIQGAIFEVFMPLKQGVRPAHGTE